MEKALKEQIVKSAKAVKRKVQILKDAKNTNNLALETIFKPIVDPLNLIANKSDGKRIKEENDYTPFVKKSKSCESEESYSPVYDFNDDVTEEEHYFDDELKKYSNKTLVVTPSKDHNVSEGSFISTWSSPNAKNQSSLSTSSFKSLSSPNIKDQSSWSTSSDVFNGVPYGIRNERGKLMLGNVRVFDDGKVLKIGTHTMKKTVGLKELLYKKKPDLDVVTHDDLQNYKMLLIETNAHRRNYNSSKQINSNKGFKYNNVIKPLFKFSRNTTSSVESLQQGKGILMKVKNNIENLQQGKCILKKVKEDTDYVYWDDPNELVERLKLLLASWEAGNTGLGNEIISIIEELREAGIINVSVYKTPALKEISNILKADHASRAK